ncbi:MAG: hypothetical protein ACJASR_001589 [Psychroserpens sp.]|jgi:hypothetical protein
MNQEEQIRRYLAGEMSSQEVQTFENLLLSDNDLKEQLEHSKYMYSILNENVIDFSNVVKEVIVTNRSKSISWLKLGIAASFLIFCFFSIYQYLNQRESYQLSDYFKPYPDLLSNRSIQDSLIDMTNYNNENYQDAIISLSKFHKGEPDLLGLYLAISYIKSDKPEEALEILNLSIKNNNPLSKEYDWYRCFALIKAKKLGEAKSLLKTISLSDSYRSESAKKLLKEL